jgi:hypothetical protein
MSILEQIPKDDRQKMQDHMTSVLIVFWAALWGTFGTEFARGFIEAQLRGMESESETYVKSKPQ